MHPSEELLAELYGCFARGDMPAMLAMCDDDITFEVPGTTSFSGTHTKATFIDDWISKVMESAPASSARPQSSSSRTTPTASPSWIIGSNATGKASSTASTTSGTSGDGKFTRFLERPGNEDEFNRAWM